MTGCFTCSVSPSPRHCAIIQAKQHFLAGGGSKSHARTHDGHFELKIPIPSKARHSFVFVLITFVKLHLSQLQQHVDDPITDASSHS
jgi:hypothetical protein